MAKNDDRRRKVEEGGKGVSVILSQDGQAALELLCGVLARQGRPHSKEAAVNRALTWAADMIGRGREPEAGQRLTNTRETAHEQAKGPESQPLTQAHEPTHEYAHESRLAALESRVDELEQAMIHGVKPGQWGGF